MIRDSGAFLKGVLLTVSFFTILGIMFMPWFGNGENALEASDRLFNSISKGSSDFIGGLQKKAEAWVGKEINVSLKMKNENMAQQSVKILTATQTQTSAAGDQVTVTGDFGKILLASLADSRLLFENKDADLEKKYGIPGREVLFVWWNIFKEMDRDLKRQSKFQEAAFLGEVVKRGVEVSFNFFGIAPESAASKAGILTFALIFYVIYTLWWGIAIMYLFEGLGLEMKAGHKKEV
jgi:hypothetical protein